MFQGLDLFLFRFVLPPSEITWKTPLILISSPAWNGLLKGAAFSQRELMGVRFFRPRKRFHDDPCFFHVGRNYPGTISSPHSPLPPHSLSTFPYISLLRPLLTLPFTSFPGHLVLSSSSLLRTHLRPPLQCRSLPHYQLFT